MLITETEGTVIKKREQRSVSVKVLDSSISLYLNDKGVKKSNKGYIFLTDAIRLGTGSPSSLLKVTELYTIIALSYGTEPYCVERGIRYAISGLGVTNKEFISCAVDEMISSRTTRGAARKLVCSKPH